MQNGKPLLTVVVVVGDLNTRSGLEQTMFSILHQSIIDQMEVLVMDCSVQGAPLLKGSGHPSIRTIKLPRATTTISRARAEGIRQAQAPIVAFLDEHSFAMTGWAESLVKAHGGPWAGVGGEIYNASSAVTFADPIYLMGHGRWVPPASRGEMDLLPSHDTCYKRDVLLRYGDRLEELLMAKPILMWRLRADGYKLFLEPDVKSVHGYKVNPLTLMAFSAWNRCFGYARARAFNWSRWRRIREVLLAPAIPLGRSFRLFLYLARYHPDRLLTFLAGLPIILLAQSVCRTGSKVYAYQRKQAFIFARLLLVELLFRVYPLKGLWLVEIKADGILHLQPGSALATSGQDVCLYCEEQIRTAVGLPLQCASYPCHSVLLHHGPGDRPRFRTRESRDTLHRT